MTELTATTTTSLESNSNDNNNVVIDESAQKALLKPSVEEIAQMLFILERNVLPVTLQGVEAGNKVFGAAILNSKYETVIAATNTETECPLFHGEVKAIYEWSKCIPASERGPTAQSSIFLSTHEPCCMCVSSILWSGFQTLYYFFPYEITTAQGIPHDINTMHELWNVPTYRKRNKYFASACLMTLIDELDVNDVGEEKKKELQATVQRLIKAYDELSNKYHSEKANNPNNSLVLD